MHQHIGIYPGTFGPVHDGHVAFAKEALDLFHLDKVVLLPERNPRNKQDVSHISTRQTLLSSALQHESKIESRVLNSNRFTVEETLPELHQAFPQCKFVFLIGSDVTVHLPTWQDLPTLVTDVSFLIAVREGDSHETVEGIFQGLEKSLATSIRYTIIGSPRPSLRSSAIRNS